MHSAVSGGQFTLSAGGFSAVVTESGAGLRVLRLDGQDLVLSYGPQQVAPAAFGQLLIPWPNRIERGQYSWEGHELQLDISEPRFDCAIHGLVRWLPWSLESQTPEAVALTCRLLGSPGYPFRLALRAEYTLDAGSGLTTRVTALNDGETAAPYGHGAHPYLTVGEPIDGCTVQAPGRRHLPVDAMMIPRGPAEPVDGTPFDLRVPRALGDLRIDRAFTDLERDADGRAWVHLTGSARTTSLWSDRAHPWLELYTADSVPAAERRGGLGAEPMTCPPNAFASRTDLVVLQPGDVFTGTWGITSD